MSSSIAHVIEGWKQLNYSELLRDLDRSVTEVAKKQDESDASRKRLVEFSREYKRNTHEDIRRPVAPLLKKFQTEIDDLSKRAKSVEAALLDVFKKLIDVPDPVPALEHAMTVQKKLQRMQDIEIENKQLRDTLDEYNTEFAEVKNQEVTIKQLREKIRELEEDAGETIAARIRERERELAMRYGDLERDLSERQMEVAAKLGETELKNKTLQSAMEKTQAELIEMKLKFEELSAAKTDEIDILLGDIDKANERATSLERENQALSAQMERCRTDQLNASEAHSSGLDLESAEESIRRSELEMELTSKEKEISQLVEEVRRLQGALKQSQETSNARIHRLEEELREKTETLSNLESRVSAREDYDEVKRELDVIRAMEFNTSDGKQESDSEGTTKPKPLEQLLIEKNKSLQNEVTQLKVVNQQQGTSSSSSSSSSSTTTITLPSSVLDSLSTVTPTISISVCSPPAPKLTIASSDTESSSIEKNSDVSEVATDLSSTSLHGADAAFQPALVVTNDVVPPLDTFKVAQKVREVLSTHNIGQRLFAKHVLGLSQGTVSELLSKPKTWDKLTEKGRDSYRRMYAWVGNNDQVLALKALAPRKGYSIHFSTPTTATPSSNVTSNTTQVVVSANAGQREDQATEEKINAILNEAKRAMDSSGGFGGRDPSKISHHPPILPRKMPNTIPNGGLIPLSCIDVKAIETALQMISCIKPVQGVSRPMKAEKSETFDDDKASVNDALSGSSKSSNSDTESKPSTVNAGDTSGLVRRIYYEELCKISANATRVGDKASFEKYQDEISRLERDHPELKDASSQPATTSGSTGIVPSMSKSSTTQSATSGSVGDNSGKAPPPSISPLAKMTQITKSLAGITRPFSRTLFFGEMNSPVACDLSRNASSPTGMCKTTLQPLSQDFLESFEPICTESLVSKVKELLSLHSISQRVFGDQVLGLSQGSVSDLLARPKAWNMLTHKGKEPFIRMQLFMKDPKAIEALIQGASHQAVVNDSVVSSKNAGCERSESVKSEPIRYSTSPSLDAKPKITTLKLTTSPSPPAPPVLSSMPQEAPIQLTLDTQPKREETPPREALQLMNSVPPLSETQANATPASIYHLAKTSTEVDTLTVSNCIKEVLQVNNLGQRLFGEVVLGLSQGSVSELLSKPKPWSQLSIKGREPYIRMQKWLDDVKNNSAVEKLKERQKELKGTRCPKRSQDYLCDVSPNHMSSASKKPRVVFSESQKHILLSIYNREPYPSSSTLVELSRQLSLPLKTINNWFHNHRMRTKMFIGPSTSPNLNCDSPSSTSFPVFSLSSSSLITGFHSVLDSELTPCDLRVKVVKKEESDECALDLATCSGGVNQSVHTSNHQTSQPVNKRKRTNPTRIPVWKQEPMEDCDFGERFETSLSMDSVDQFAS